MAFWLTAHLALAGEWPGIVATATDGERTIRFVAPTPNFTLEPGQSIHPQLKPEFRAEWTGFLKIPRSGNYRLLLTDGKSALGQQTLTSERGLMPVHLTYERKPGRQQQQLWWESDFFRAEPIPSYAYVYTNDPSETASAAQLERGRQLLEDFNCAACHRTDNSIFRGRVAPDLSDAGSRLKKEWVYRWLENPRHFQTNATMPALLQSGQERADVAAYLDALRSPAPPMAGAAGLSGKTLFDKIGCAGCHSASLAGVGSKWQTEALAAYLMNPLACDASGRMPGMNLTATEAGALANFLAESKNTEFEQSVPPGNAARGKELVVSRGCLNCHTLHEGATTVGTRLSATPLAGLRNVSGCLSTDAAETAPQFHLTEDEREAFMAFLASPDVSAAPVQDVQRWMTQFQCAVCHAWHGPAGLELGRNQEPPALTDAGNKLRRSWIEEVMTTTNRVRPWIDVRMPEYGTQNVSGFFDGFAEQAGAEEGEGARITNPRVDLADEGMHYIGTDDEGLSCITCHDFRGEPSHGDLHSPELTTIDDRLRTDWLERWLYEPSRITPGTSMPDFFASKPPQESDKIVRRMLQALAMGPKMPDAPGWHQDPRAYLIIVSNMPVVQRCLLPDVSARAIAVGLPGNVSFAFDAAGCQLAYAWTGAFLDAKPTWTWRGGMPPRVLGRKFYIAPSPGPLRFGKREAPEAQFLGYDLTNGLPVFSYKVGSATVKLLTTTEFGALICSYEVSNASEPVWFDCGPGATVTADPPPQSAEDNWWKMAPGNPVRFTVRVPVQ